MQDTVCRVIKDKEHPYAIYSLEVINKKMSAKAKGILTYLLSKPNSWKFNMQDIENHFTDGPDSIRSGLKELQILGYLYRKRYQHKDSKKFYWKWLIYEIPNQYDENDFEQTPTELFDN